MIDPDLELFFADVERRLAAWDAPHRLIWRGRLTPAYRRSDLIPGSTDEFRERSVFDVYESGTRADGSGGVLGVRMNGFPVSENDIGADLYGNVLASCILSLSRSGR